MNRLRGHAIVDWARRWASTLFGFAKHPDAQLRVVTAWVIGICRSDTSVAYQLARMTRDAEEQVAAEAARALLGVAGRARFLRAAEAMSEAALLEAIDDLRFVADARSMLERLPRAAPAVQRRVEEILATL